MISSQYSVTNFLTLEMAVQAATLKSSTLALELWTSSANGNNPTPPRSYIGPSPLLPVFGAGTGMTVANRTQASKNATKSSFRRGS